MRIFLTWDNEGGFCKASEPFLPSRGFNRHLVVLRERQGSKKENSCGHSLYSQNIFGGLHNEQRKTQEEYHSKEICK